MKVEIVNFSHKIFVTFSPKLSFNLKKFIDVLHSVVVSFNANTALGTCDR